MFLKFGKTTAVFLTLFSQICLGLQCGFTVWGGPAGVGKKCAFPFVVGGVTYNTCTIANEGKKRPWCATKTDSQGDSILKSGKMGRHDILSNDWGYCDPACEFADRTGVIRTTTPDPNQTTRRTTRRTTSTEIPYNPALTSTTTTTTTTLRPLDLTIFESTSGLWLPDKEYGECGYKLNTGYILGGVDAARGEFPFAVLLGYKNAHRASKHPILYRCGGSLINRKYVLTAAHCHEENNEANKVIEVLVGEHTVGPDPDCSTCPPMQRFIPEEIILHEGFGFRDGAAVVVDDIALIRLKGTVTTIMEDQTIPVMAVCLPPPNLSEKDLPESKQFVVFGWGKASNINDGDIKLAGVANRQPQKLIVPTYNHYQCGLQFVGLDGNQICAGGEKNRDSCDGDSGGPLVDLVGPNDQNTLYGIVSAGSKVCGIGAPGIYTRVDKYIGWIQHHIRE